MTDKAAKAMAKARANNTQRPASPRSESKVSDL